MDTTEEQERIAVEMLDPQDQRIFQGTARVTRCDLSGEMTGVDDYRSLEGRPVALPPGNYRWVLKLTTAETPVVAGG